MGWRNLALFGILIGLATFQLIHAGNVCAQISFDRDIRPILSDNCFRCHGPDSESRATDLRLDLRDSATADLGGYQAISPGSLTDSHLIDRITTDDSDRMPPEDSGKRLEPEEIEILKKWIQAGAEWPDYWAYVDPQRTEPPVAKDDQWSRNWIDRFVFDRIQSEQWKPAPAADPTTLLRRLYFDLIGLPPTPAQVEQFCSDSSDEEYLLVVNQLLDSQHFGERLAIYWLDLVRYADTVGYHGDQDHNISPYRDWVIQAFNENMPFDQFTREQLAGDLLRDPSRQQLIATGYNRLLQTTHEGGLQPKEYRAIYAADRVRNVSAVWMGSTMGCAQCHDHKYDPYTTRDFYSMSAFFADVDDERHFKVGTNSLPTRRPPEILIAPPDDLRQWEQINQEVRSLEKQKRELAALQKQPAVQLGQDGESGQNKLQQIEAEIAAKKSAATKIENRNTWTMITRALESPRVTRVFPRGNWLDESGPVVQPAIPEFLGNLPADSRLTRMDLANWLVDTESGVGKRTARVMANRIWYLLMGRGISPSLDDFGGQGQPPVAPELLDNLALEFCENGWNLKDLIRMVVTSSAYRQSSVVPLGLLQRDPFNELFARQSRFRLPAEMIRDNALFVSGLLNLKKVGGKSVKPYQPPGYYQHLNFPPRKYQQDHDDRQWRRGVYVHWQRQFLHPTLKSLDAPMREECTAERPRSNTPLSALALLNDPSFVAAAQALATRVLQQGEITDDSARLATAFQLVTSRAPDQQETAILFRLLRDGRREYREQPPQAAKLVESTLNQAPDGISVDELAAWTHVARALLNLDETITRN